MNKKTTESKVIKNNDIKKREVHSSCRILLATAFVLIACNGFSQFADTRYAIGSAGRSVTAGDGITYMFNIGEPAITTATPSGFIITQGFEQPPYARDTSLIPNEPIDVPDEILVNVFSPDGDGVNDVWIVEQLNVYTDNEVFIMNRWGDQVWSAKNYDNTTVVWDGKNTNGVELTNGTYFYVIKINNFPKSYSGWVQVTK
ncbi:MAG: gliding motility-associated C-terminal domain-containing protein [Crocinitomicaceae bacterium]|nr:gliding motility-associated C-terminal domain-containing protein [Crocinitomicaceae bacterium]